MKCSDGVKDLNGCERDSTLGERWSIGQYKLKRCPLKEITQEGLEYLEAYKFYLKGILPMSGGWLDQAQTLLQAIRIIETEIEQIEKQTKKE